MDSKIANQIINENTIDLKALFRIFLRNKLLISALSSSATLLTIIFSLIETPIYKGNFQIVVNQTQEQNSTKDFSVASLSEVIRGGGPNDNKTQEYILKSPLVLKPVFNRAIEEYKKRGANNEMLYALWIEKNLKIEFEKGTKVLKITFKDSDKDFILEILNIISQKYQNYSKQIKEKELNKTLSYLNIQQKSFKEISKRSAQELNSFSIKHGLGNLDGFLPIESVNNKNGNNPPSSNNLGSNAGQRYAKQFSDLENHEAQLIYYSSKLKPSSQIIKNLKIKIDNLKESLKRPNEILLTYRELNKKALRDETLLNEIEIQLQRTKLAIAKQREPWELISEPTISKDRVSPQRKKMVILGFASSLFISCLLSVWKEKSSGKVYELNELVSLLNCNYIDTLYLNNETLNMKLIEDILMKENKNQKTNKSNQEFNIIKFTNENTDLFLKNGRLINFKDDEIVKNNNLIILISPGMINLNQIVLINRYIKIYKEKFIGWFYLNEKKIS